MIKNKRLLSAAILSSAIALNGCTKATDSDVAKTNPNAKPSATASAVNSNTNNVGVDGGANVSVGAQNGAMPVLTANGSATTPTANKQKNAPPVKEPTAQIGSGGGDMFLFTQVRGALGSDRELLDGVIVQLKEGNVTLTGNVSSPAQKTKAEQLVKNVAGVKSVKNDLRVAQ